MNHIAGRHSPNHILGNGVTSTLLYNYTGKLVGYQQYRPFASKIAKNHPRLGRYYTYLPKDTDGFYGVEQDSGVGRLYIVEGIFKAAALHSIDRNAIAVLTSTPKRLKPLFKILKQTRELYAIGDNDSAGQRLVNIVGKGTISPLDLDEMTNLEEFINGLE